MSNSERRKGLRVEQEIVNLHKEAGIHAERVPLSGGAHYRSEGHDVDIYAFGRDAAPAVSEVKARKDGRGFALLERWLGEYDALFLKRDRQEPLVVIRWRMWVNLIRQARTFTHAGKTKAKARRKEKPAEGAEA